MNHRFEEEAESAIALAAQQVRSDVESFLANGAPVLVDRVWTIAVDCGPVSILVSIDANGRMVKNVVGDAALADRPDIVRMTHRFAFMVSKQILPILLRLTPRPPFISGDTPVGT